MDYDFPVSLEPIYLKDGQEITNRKAVVRTDTMQTLSVVSNEYGLVKHSSVIDTFREAAHDYNIKEQVSLTNDGGNLFYEMLFPKVEAEVSKGDIVRLRMIVKNSYNGKNSLQIVFGALRLVCLNGMVIGTQFLSFMYRHTQNIGILSNDESLDSGQVKDSLKKYIGTFSDSMKQMTAMTKTPMISITSDDVFVQDHINLPNYLLAEAKQKFEEDTDKSVWGFYNSLTFAITHKARKQNPSMAIDYGSRAWRAAEYLIS